jgi:hypothetical protein
METTWLLAETVLLTPVEPEAVLLNTLTGDRYVLNPLGTAICALLQTGSTIAEITTQIERQFPQAIDRVSPDVGEFIEQLQSEGLIVPKPN